MEIKINKEIREYREQVFFGLSLRQLIFSVIACVCAAGIDFLMRGHAGTEVISWVCIICSLPFALAGFVRYNGMSAVQLASAWIRSAMLEDRKLIFRSHNRYAEMISVKRKASCHSLNDRMQKKPFRMSGILKE